MRSFIGGLMAISSLVQFNPVTSYGADIQMPLGQAPQPHSNGTAALLKLHKDLIDIESISGNEHDVGIFVAEFLESKGFTIKKQKLPPLERNPHDSRRYNIYAYNGADGPESKVLVTSHIDTVPPFYKYRYDAEKDQVWGRGSVDAKGSVAAQITATLELLESGEIGRGDVSLLFVCSEEVDGRGMKKANELGLTWKAGIFGEPTELKLVEGHKGILSFAMQAHGKAAHSGYPWLGIDANAALVHAMAGLLAADLPSSDKYGNTTVNVGSIRAGVAANVVSAYGVADVQIRVAAGEPDEIKEKVRNATGDAVELHFRTGYAPVDCDTDVDGFDTVVVNYGTDVPNLERHRVGKRYLYGPGTIFLAHGDHEHIQVGDLVKAVDGYKKLIKHALKA